MNSDHLDQQVTDTFQKLNAPHQKRTMSRFGIYISWASLLLLAGCLVLVAIYINELDQRAEQIRLHQSVTQVAKTVETRLTRTVELLKKASVRLIHIPSVQTSLSSVELAAAGVMHERREIIEMSIVDKNDEVTRHWVSPSNNSIVTHHVGDKITDPELRQAFAKVMRGDTFYISAPFTIDHKPFAFVNVIVPTMAGNQVVLARINLTRMINETADYTDNSSYVFYIERDGEPLIDRGAMADKFQAQALKSAVRITAFNSPTFRLVGLSYRHNLFNTSNASLWTMTGLAFLLIAALFLLIYYQRQQHRAHQRLSAEYALRVAISESAMAGLRVTDRNGRILFVNETFTRLVGYSTSELIGRSMPYPYWDDSVTAMKESVLSHPNEPLQQSLEIRVRRKDGLVFDAQINVSPLLNEHKRLIGWVGELYDITEQKRARERMRAAHERFTRVVQSMNSAICVVRRVDGVSTILFNNAPYEQLLGRNANGAERLIDLVKAIPRTISREGIFDEVTQRWFDARMQTITWTDDQPAQMLIATDITGQRETELALEAQLRRSETTQRLVTMGEMASSLAHELNQPLAAISNYASGAEFMLTAGKLSTESTVEALTKINKQAKRAALIIKRIRGFAKRSDPQLMPIRAETVVSETMELAQIQAAKLRSEIHIDMPETLPTIRGDAVMLEQLLLNILKNAMEASKKEDHTKSHVELTLRESEDGEFVLFSIQDHGPGISDENKARLFDAFFSTKDEGMGMGLNICRSIVELHQGRIRITDTPGGGATFTFSVPVCHGEVSPT